MISKTRTLYQLLGRPFAWLLAHISGGPAYMELMQARLMDAYGLPPRGASVIVEGIKFVRLPDQGDTAFVRVCQIGMDGQTVTPLATLRFVKDAYAGVEAWAR